MKPRPLFWCLASSILLADQLSKAYIARVFIPSQSRDVIPGFFNITYVLNDGIAFGLFQGHNILLALVALAVLGAGFWMARNLDWQTAEVNILAAMITAGAIGNLIDRLRVGYVIDFLDFHFKHRFAWPAFNIADACISTSILYLCLRLWLKPTKASH